MKELRTIIRESEKNYKCLENDRKKLVLNLGLSLVSAVIVIVAIMIVAMR